MNGNATPAKGALAFIWYFVRQAKWPFALMLVLGGGVALLEAALFYFVGRLVDLLDSSNAADGWSGLFAQHGSELWFMLAVVLVGRLVIAPLVTLVEEQTIVPGFFNLVRWQAYAHIARQSLTFFHDDFAGRVVTKVWQSGQAVGDFMTSLLQVVWFIAIYAVTTLALVAQLDWQLAAIVAILDRRLCCHCALFCSKNPSYGKIDGGGGVDAQRPPCRQLFQHSDVETVFAVKRTMTAISNRVLILSSKRYSASPES